MKQMKRALLSTAILAGLYTGGAMAGTEACFEVLKATDALTAVPILDRWSTIYQKAGCDVGAGPADQKLAGFSPISVAYEMTGNLQLNFNDVDGNSTLDDLAMPFYIPTTDLPGGSRIEIAIAGGHFANNGNQLHLIQASYDAVNSEYVFESVASSDDQVDGGQLVTFVTKAANTVGAGTRLFISRTSVHANIPAAGTGYENLQPLNIGINNEGCPTNPDVLLSATAANTDGGSPIVGGKSRIDVDNSILTLVSASPQFKMFTTGSQAGFTGAEVNAEVPSLRTEFVASHDGTNWTPTKARPDFIWYTMGATDAGSTLDRSITITSADSVRIHAAATNSTGSTVRFDAYNTTTAGALGTASSDLSPAQVFNVAPTFGENLSWSTTANGAYTIPNFAIGEADDPASVAARYLRGDDVFTAAADDIQFTVENTSSGVMNFNYGVNVRWGIDFQNGDYIDLGTGCNMPVNTHQVGVNGAVLKVPYTVDATGNFVRISNEHTSDALVTFDIFSEDPALNAAGKETVNIELGVLPPKASIVYNVSDLVALAAAQGYTEYAGATVTNGQGTNGKRHFMTFTVTAPKNKVHGVSVQKVTNGVDRVIPVLDQNDWSQ